MTKTLNYTSTEDYCKSPDYYREKRRLQGYNEVMKFLNEFCPLQNPEARKVANMMEIDFSHFHVVRLQKNNETASEAA